MKLLADYLFLTEEKVSALEYYKEALARVEARTEHDRAKPQTQSFSAQVSEGGWGKEIYTLVCVPHSFPVVYLVFIA